MKATKMIVHQTKYSSKSNVNYNSAELIHVENNTQMILAIKSYERIIDSIQNDGRLILQNSYKTEGNEQYEVRIGHAHFLGSSSGADITLQHERFVNDVDNAVSTLDIRPEHMDPVAVPLNVVVCGTNKLVNTNLMEM